LEGVSRQVRLRLAQEIQDRYSGSGSAPARHIRWIALNLCFIRHALAVSRLEHCNPCISVVCSVVQSLVVTRVSNRLVLEHGLEAFRAGDLRRTCETMLESLGIPKELRGQLLSHGRNTGVQAKHYDRYAYLPEKKQALQIWADHLAKILITPTSRAVA